MSDGDGRQRQPGLSTRRRRALAVALPLLFGACNSGNGTSDRAVPTSSSSSSTAASTSTSASTTTSLVVNGGTAPGPVTGTASTPTTANFTPVPAEITLRGTVAGVFASARVIQLVPPANGTASVALSADTEFVRAGGGRATLADVTTGATIEAVGHSSAPGTIVARKVTLL